MNRYGKRPWAVPLVAVGTVVGLATVPALLASAGANTPTLPKLSAAELLAKARTAQLTPLSGTIELTTSLGLPSLGSLGGGSSTVTSLLSGAHTALVWVGGPGQLRIAQATPLAETNWIRNGADLWSWDSATLRAVHVTLPPDGAGQPDASVAAKAAEATPDPANETPMQFADELLAKVDPTTVVTVRDASYVAGRPVYELAVSPRAAGSTIGEAVLSIDADSGLPLRVQVTPNGSSTPAFVFGFADVSFSKPDASRFDFTPPPGATVVTSNSPSDLLDPAGANRPKGHHWHDRTGAGGPVPLENAPAATPATPGGVTGPEVTTVGQNWETVAVISGQSIPTQVSAILNGATRVTAGGVSGRLLTSRLLNVLLLDDGRIAVGAVTPEVLEHAVAGP